MLRVQNVSAQVIGDMKPGKIYEVKFEKPDGTPAPEREARFRKSAAVRGKKLVILETNEKPRPMPPANIPEISRIHEGTALHMVAAETDLDVLSAWHVEELNQPSGEKRPALIAAISRRGLEIARSAPPAPVTGKLGTTVLQELPGQPAHAPTPQELTMRPSTTQATPPPMPPPPPPMPPVPPPPDTKK